MSISQDDLEKTADLARIALDPEKSQGTHDKIAGVLAFIDKLNEVNVGDILPLAHPLGIKQRLREDEVTEENNRDTLLACSSKTEAGLYLVNEAISTEG